MSSLFNVVIRFHDAVFQGKMIDIGRVKVNGKPTTRDYVLKNGDLIENLVHR